MGPLTEYIENLAGKDTASYHNSAGLYLPLKRRIWYTPRYKYRKYRISIKIYLNNEQVMNNAVVNFIQDMPGIVFCKNKDSTYVASSAASSKFLFGKANPIDSHGMNDFQIPGEAASFATSYAEQDRDVITTGKKLIILDISSWADRQRRVFITEKFPCHNKQYALGICREITDPFLSNVYRTLTRSIYIDASTDMTLTTRLPHEPYKLTKREEICLFFIIRGKTSTAIAKLLHLSPRTIEDIINRLKYKFNCNSKLALIDKALDLGYINTIPTDFLLELKPTSSLLSALEN